MNKLIFMLITLLNFNLIPRSIHRPRDLKLGYIKTNWENSDKEYFLFDSHLREIPVFHTYNHDHFIETLAPKNIPLKDGSNQNIEISKLNELIEKLIEELITQKKKLTDFKILKQRDYNIFTKTGNIILKFKNHPFILKLFLETPESLSQPFSKAFQARGIFNLGGSFRHLMGFTRIKNLELIQEKIKDHPEWAHKIKFPRKWSWLPKNQKWIEITGYNLGNKEEQYIKVPAIYGIICDEMKGIDNEKRRKEYYDHYLRFCTYLNYTLDALPANFLLSENDEILLIDTEHFAILTGIQKKLEPVNDYYSWFIRTARKYIKEKLLSEKSYRRARQANNKTEVPLYD